MPIVTSSSRLFSTRISTLTAPDFGSVTSRVYETETGGRASSWAASAGPTSSGRKKRSARFIQYPPGRFIPSRPRLSRRAEEIAQGFLASVQGALGDPQADRVEHAGIRQAREGDEDRPGRPLDQQGDGKDGGEQGERQK